MCDGREASYLAPRVSTLVQFEADLVDNLQHELGLKELQINRLLNITQAINENRPASELFEMYANFLNWDLSIPRMALYYRRAGHWVCASEVGLTDDERERDVSAHFDDFASRGPVGAVDDALLAGFDFVIPVTHKEEQLVYVFCAGLSDSPDDAGRVQVVTAITHVVAVAIENKWLFRRQLEQERYQAELELATEIQRGLIPASLPSGPHFDMAALYRPRFGVGGDFYSAEYYEDGRLLFCVADIAGKGTGAALLMSNFEASFWSLGRARTTLSQFVQALNTALFRVTRGDRFLTLFVGEYDANTRQLTYVNAGHNPPLIVEPDCADPHELTTGCTFLGAFEEIPRIDTGRVDLSYGGLLFCYTDGVTEMASPSGEMYGEDRLCAFACGRGGSSAEEFNAALDAELSAFQSDAEPTDDTTVLSVRFRGVDEGEADEGEAAGA